MGTNSEEQCNAASFFLVATPSITKCQVLPEVKPLQSTPLGSWWKTSKNRAEGPQHWGAGTSHGNLSLRVTDDSAQSPQSVPGGHCLKQKNRNLSPDLGLPLLTAEMVPQGVWGQTPRRNVVSAALVSDGTWGECFVNPEQRERAELACGRMCLWVLGLSSWGYRTMTPLDLPQTLSDTFPPISGRKHSFRVIQPSAS